MRIGVIIGSLSGQSINRRLWGALAEVIGDRAELHELRIDELPVYNRDLDERFPDSALRFKAALGAIDGLVIVTPEYNRAIPAALKNALEWGSRPPSENAFPGIPVGVLGASAGRVGTAVAQGQLRTVLAHLDMPTLGQPEFFLHFDPDHLDPATGAARDPELRGRLETFAARLLAHVERNPRR